MVNIAPELLSNTSPSPYRSAFEKRYCWLRFGGPLEGEFQSFYSDGHPVQVRVAACRVISLFDGFSAIDLASLPS